MNPDFIEVYDNALSSKQCKEIIKFIESQKLVIALLDGQYRPYIKDAYQVVGDLNVEHFTSVYLLKSLVKCVEDYWVKYPQVKFNTVKSSLYPWQPDNNFNFQKYNPGQGYPHSHCENTGRDTSRVLVWMFYLNTITDNGGTYFNSYDKITDSIEGRCVIWPAHWTHHHKGIISNTQTKYIATGWFVHV